MFDRCFRSRVSVLVGVVGCCGIMAVTASAQSPASISVGSELSYRVTTLTIGGDASCSGGGTAGVNVVDGSLEQMFSGGIGGPIAIKLDGSVLIDCDGASHNWSGNLIAPGRALPNDSGGMVTVNLTQGSSVIASTGSRPVHIVS